MSRSAVDPNNPPRTAEELYACATVTSDLGLPHGEGAGAQGVLAAAAWSEVHLGSALRRLRDQWERDRPMRHHPRTREQLAAAGMTREAARATHKRERLELAQSYYRRRLAAFSGLRDLPAAREALTLHAAGLGMEDCDVKAATILQQWLDRRSDPSFGEDGYRLMAYLDDCLNRARVALRMGMRGQTNHRQDAEG